MISRSILLLLLSLAEPTAFAQIDLLPPANATAAQSNPNAAASSAAQRIVSVDSTAIHAMKAGDEATVTTPGGKTHVVVFDRSVTGYGGGKVWIGHLRNHDHDCLVLVSTFEGAVSGSIDTPDTKLRLGGTEKQIVMTDLLAAGQHVFTPTQDDIVRAPKDSNPEAAAPLSAIASPALGATSNTQIDLLFLYSPNLGTRLGGVQAVVARANQLVALANQIYSNSGINVTLNIVNVQQLNTSYADSSDDTTALGNTSPASGLTGDANVAALRNHYGADLVTLLRPFVGSVCGLGWLPGNFSSSSSAYGYSVVEDGSLGSAYCDNSSMTHELGHNMGAAHDVYTTVTNNPSGSINGTPAYNRGYCNGSAGTIMSYAAAAGGCSPLVHYFSNPALNTCAGKPCGVPQNVQYTAIGTSTTATGADSATAINANTQQIAIWRNSTYFPLVPARLLDTRSGSTTVDGQYAGGGKIAGGGTLTPDLAVLGRGGMPAVGANAVVLNVTAVNPASVGFLTVWPAGATRPLAANLNLNPGYTIPNLVIAKLGSNSQVSIYNGGSAGIDVVADVQGWFPSASSYMSISPLRLLDTRSGFTTYDGQFQGTGAPPSQGQIDLTVVGRAGIPANAVAVALNVTAVDPQNVGYVTVFPDDATTRPLAANLNLNPGMTIPNLVISKIGGNGKVAIYNGGLGPTDLVADVQGWFPATGYNALTPARFLDTRAGSTTIDGQYQGTGAFASGETRTLTVTGRTGGPPATGVGAVVLNVTAVDPQGVGYITVWPGGTQPLAANLNLSPGKTIPNLVIAQVGANGQISIYNGGVAATDLVVDVQGWFSAAP